MGYYYRASRKNPLAEADRQVALDAFLEGRIDEGEAILKRTNTALTKPQAKKAAKAMMAAGKIDAAARILATAMGKEAVERELREEPTANVGDVLYTSGGYEQTNVSFYEVVAVSGQSATIRKIAKRRVGGTEYSDEVVGDRGAYVGPPMKKRVQKGYRKGEYEIKVGDSHAWLWNGKPQRETAAGYGH